MSSHFTVAEHQGYFFDIHRHQPSTSHGTTTYASSPLPSPPLSSARKPKLPSLFDRASASGSFTIPFKSNKHIADNAMERDEYEAEYKNALELKPITHNQKAQIQMLPSIQQIVTPSNSPSPQPMTTINQQLLGHKSCNEFFDTFTASSEGSIGSPNSRKGSIASLLNTDDNITHAEQMDSNDIIIQIYDPDKQQKNYPTAVLAPRGRPPHSVSGNRKRRMNSDCIIHGTSSSELPSNQGMSDLGNHHRKRYRSATSSKSYIDPDLSIPSAAQQQQQQRAVGLRHFSEQVCKKVREKQVTTYNAVADELASDIQLFYSEGHYDQKNIRRRVYDALNVLMAMGIISKDRKEIRWLGLSSLQQPSSNELVSPASMMAFEDKKLLEQKLENLQQSIKDTRQRLVHKVKQYTLFRNVVKRNMAAPVDGNKQLPLPLVALSCKKRNNLPVKVHTTSDASSITVTGNISVTGLTNDTDLMERMGLNQINMSQYNRWFRSSWHPFCSSLVLTDSH